MKFLKGVHLFSLQRKAIFNQNFSSSFATCPKIDFFVPRTKLNANRKACKERLNLIAMNNILRHSKANYAFQIVDCSEIIHWTMQFCNEAKNKRAPKLTSIVRVHNSGPLPN
jgi:hypothetical protein